MIAVKSASERGFEKIVNYLSRISPSYNYGEIYGLHILLYRVCYQPPKKISNEYFFISWAHSRCKNL